MLPFDESRRLTGPSLLLDHPGVVLEVPAEWSAPDAIDRWRQRVDDMCARLGWPAGDIVARVHAHGASLAFAAPEHALLTATEVNEWAWLGAVESPEPWPTPLGPGQPVHDAASSVPLLRLMARTELPSQLPVLLAAARSHGVPVIWDEEAVTLGAGRWSRTWPMSALPEIGDVAWRELRGVPMAFVGGSNGKTTTVRLIAAMCGAHGWHAGLSSTDGVRVNGVHLEEGDWSGPAGARMVLRDPQVEAAVLETARGGILRRGLAVTGAQAAVVTNIQLDHFGEGGVDGFASLAQVKLVVAKGLAPNGLLVLNADDPHLVQGASTHDGRIGWFSLDAEQPLIASARAAGVPCAALDADAQLMLYVDGASVELGSAAALPLSMGGLARYNIANALGASLVAWALGVHPAEIRRVLGNFGADRADNPGRLARWFVNGVTVLIDYAHNPEGMAGLLGVASALRGVEGRLIVLLGQAGNREDDAIRALVRVVASAHPARVVIKDMEALLRGRAPGEVPALIARTLRDLGVEAEAMEQWPNEPDAARAAFAHAAPGDVVVLPLHTRAARDELSAWFDLLASSALAVPR